MGELPGYPLELELPPEFEAQTPGAFVMIFRLYQKHFWSKEDLQVLLVHRKDRDIWNLPGGGHGKDEHPVDAAIRETLEETGLEVGVARDTETDTVVCYKVMAGPLDSGMNIPAEARHDLYRLYIGVILGGEITLSEEARDIRWFSVRNLPENLYFRHELVINMVSFEPFSEDLTKEAIVFAARHHSFIPELATGLGDNALAFASNS